MSAIVELLHAQRDLQLLNIPRKPRDDARAQRHCRTRRIGIAAAPNPLPWNVVQPTAFEFTEPLLPVHDRLDRNEVDQVVAAVWQHWIAQANEAARFARAESRGMNRELQ